MSEPTGADAPAEAPARAPTRVFHPLLFAAWPALDLWARNPSEVLAKDALGASAVLALATYLIYRIARLVLRDATRAGLATSLFVILFFTYSALHGQAAELNAKLGWTFLAGNANALRHRYMVALIVLVLGTATLWLWRTRRNLLPATRAANLFAVVLVLLAGSRIATAKMTNPGADTGDDPAALSAGDAATVKPDIYYILLDRYANGETLAKAYAFDNTPFYQDLEKRGFHVNPDQRCNYARTTLSYSSQLNMEYHGEAVHKSKVVTAMRRRHRVGEFLKAQGYEYLHLGSWWTPTAMCGLADRNINHPAARTSEFPIALLKMTPLAGLPAFNGYEFAIHGETAVFQFAELREIARQPTKGPRLVVAHILMPHPPFVFDRHGNKIPTGRVKTYGQAAKHNYLEHLRFTNTRMIEVVDGILTHAKRPTVIILQGDEGPFLRGEDKTADRMEQIRIRTGVLSAIYTSDGAEAFAGMKTPVNTFRILLNKYFDAGLELLEERVFLWKGMLRPVEPDCRGLHTFEDITDSLLK